jgi:hypothetical protein
MNCLLCLKIVVCISVCIGVWSVAESAERVSQVAEGREDVCLIAVGYCRSGATFSEWPGGKVSSFWIFHLFDPKG